MSNKNRAVTVSPAHFRLGSERVKVRSIDISAFDDFIQDRPFREPDGRYVRNAWKLEKAELTPQISNERLARRSVDFDDALNDEGKLSINSCVNGIVIHTAYTNATERSGQTSFRFYPPCHYEVDLKGNIYHNFPDYFSVPHVASKHCHKSGVIELTPYAEYTFGFHPDSNSISVVSPIYKGVDKDSVVFKKTIGLLAYLCYVYDLDHSRQISRTWDVNGLGKDSDLVTTPGLFLELLVRVDVVFSSFEHELWDCSDLYE